jgi:RNAse (barnase) inhibitor barstar
MSILEAFTFVPRVREFAADDALVARVVDVAQAPKQLFELFYRLFSLPGYFGFNWNALFDCLRDFDWVDQGKVVIVHDTFPALSQSEMKTYLEVLRDAVLD